MFYILHTLHGSTGTYEFHVLHKYVTHGFSGVLGFVINLCNVESPQTKNFIGKMDRSQDPNYTGDRRSLIAKRIENMKH